MPDIMRFYDFEDFLTNFFKTHECYDFFMV